MIPVGRAGAFVDEQQPEACGGPAQQLTQQLSSSRPRSGSSTVVPYFLQPAMPSSPGQRLRREQGLRCMTSFPLCALVRVFCVRPVQYCGLRHGVCERSATFWSTKRHPRLLNGSFFPLRGLTRRAFLLQKGGGAQKKAGFFRVFTAAAICGAHIGSMTA